MTFACIKPIKRLNLVVIISKLPTQRKQIIPDFVICMMLIPEENLEKVGDGLTNAIPAKYCPVTKTSWSRIKQDRKKTLVTEYNHVEC